MHSSRTRARLAEFKWQIYAHSTRVKWMAQMDTPDSTLIHTQPMNPMLRDVSFVRILPASNINI